MLDLPYQTGRPNSSKRHDSKHDATHIFKPRVLSEDHYVLSNSSPADYDPFKNTQCNNLIHLQVSVNGGVVRGTDLNFYLYFLISDYTKQHRVFAHNDALKGIATKGAQQERNNASQQPLTKTLKRGLLAPQLGIRPYPTGTRRIESLK